MAKRSYDQTCGLATALDLLGERWTLLILRDLVLGPQRYTDLLDGLPGIGTNMLANRLRDLDSLGLVQKRELPPPAASTVYELSEGGRELEPAMATLGRWGARYVQPPDHTASLSPRMLMLGLVMSFSPESAKPLNGRQFELRVDGLTFRLWVEGERAHARQEPAVRPDAVIDVSAQVLMGLAAKHLAIEDAVAAGGAHIDGDATAARALLSAIDISMLGIAIEDRAAAPAGR
jgi:DNA-binding HxlR family transcriptional regulator/putative sterol carrier protein